MKNQTLKIVCLILIFLSISQNYCNADVLYIDPLEDLEINTIFYAIIGCVILFISATSYFFIKKNITKRIASSQDKNNFKKSNESLNKAQNILSSISMLFFITIACIIHFCEVSKANSFRLPNTTLAEILVLIVLFVPFICFITCIVFMLLKKRKKSFISFGVGITIVLVSIICSITINKIYDANVEKYNAQFLQYIENHDKYITSPRYVNNIQGLITTTMNNNINKRKTTIEFNNKTYTTPAELEELLSKIDNNVIYITPNPSKNNYIDCIALTSYLERYIELINYYRNLRSTIDITDVITYANMLSVIEPYSFLDITITYSSPYGQEVLLKINQSDDKQQMNDYLHNFDENKKYNIDIQSTLPNTINIYIAEQ